MTTNRPAACKYTEGQSVELQVTDFSPAGFAAGMPRIWVSAIVETVVPRSNGHWDVKLAYLDTFCFEIVGPRGGNSNIREV
jgi:hypothetical protein